MTEPESWAQYDEWLNATMDELIAKPFTDWAHPRNLFGYVREIVGRHFGVSERAKDLVTASLVGSMAAAHRGDQEREIAAAFKKPFNNLRRDGYSPVDTAYDEI